MEKYTLRSLSKCPQEDAGFLCLCERQWSEFLVISHIVHVFPPHFLLIGMEALLGKPFPAPNSGTSICFWLLACLLFWDSVPKCGLSLGWNSWCFHLCPSRTESTVMFHHVSVYSFLLSLQSLQYSLYLIWTVRYPKIILSKCCHWFMDFERQFLSSMLYWY